MAKLFPSKQTFVDLRDGNQVLITNVKILTTGSDHVELPNAVDAQVLQAAAATSDPSFYLTTNGEQLAIDGATVGTDYIVASKHVGGVNFFPGRASADNPK